MASMITKRTGTRSQASINDYFHPIPSDQSPLKAARRAARTGTRSGPSDDIVALPIFQLVAPILSSPHGVCSQLMSRKRSPSPDSDANATSELSTRDDRQMKRAKLDGGAALVRELQSAPSPSTKRAVFGATKSRHASDLSSSFPSPVRPSSSATTPGRRVCSVPPASPSKVVDLRSLSPSRHGAFTSPGRRLRYQSVPLNSESLLEDEGEERMDLELILVPPPSSDPSDITWTSPPFHRLSCPPDDASDKRVNSSGIYTSHLSTGSPPSPLTPLPATPAPGKPPTKNTSLVLPAARQMVDTNPITPKPVLQDDDDESTPTALPAVPSYFAFPESSPDRTPERLEASGSMFGSAPSSRMPPASAHVGDAHEQPVVKAESGAMFAGSFPGLPLESPALSRTTLPSCIPVPSQPSGRRPELSVSPLSSMSPSEDEDESLPPDARLASLSTVTPMEPTVSSTRARTVRGRTRGKVPRPIAGKPHITRSRSKQTEGSPPSLTILQETRAPADVPLQARKTSVFGLPQESKALAAPASQQKVFTADVPLQARKTLIPSQERSTMISRMKPRGGGATPVTLKVMQLASQPPTAELHHGAKVKEKERASNVDGVQGGGGGQDVQVICATGSRETEIQMAVDSACVSGGESARGMGEVMVDESVAGPSAPSTAQPAKPPKATPSFAAPTTSSLSKAMVKTSASPRKPHSQIAYRQPPLARDRASSPTKPASSGSRPLPPNQPSRFTSLSNLSEALERVRSRPVTSMGFNPDNPRLSNIDHLRPRDDTHIGSSSPSKRRTSDKVPPPVRRVDMLPSSSREELSVRPSASLMMTSRSGASLKQSKLSFAAPMGASRAAGFAHRRVFASQKSSLPVVQGSPVRNDGTDVPTSHADGAEATAPQPVVPMKGKARLIGGDEDRAVGPIAPMNLSSAIANNDACGDLEMSLTSLVGSQSESEPGVWKNASRRASMARQFLNETIAAGVPETPPRRGRTSTSDMSETSPSERARSLRSGGVQPRSEPSGSGKARTLKVLKSCTVFVDVRTDDGVDAGGLFVEMLRNLGARVNGRVGPACTHIVFKNGLLDDPKPKVVGIAWVVECVEKRTLIDESKFSVDLEGVNIAGVNKRRRSMLPKHIADTSSDPSAASDNTLVLPFTPTGSPPTADQSMDSDASFNGPGDLPPLERARLRRLASQNSG
ncbi:hypothetical protein K488DRAFT_88162 [Vararia minispora EC-137]|uniref:Uncharacterized protein n=1 Tax=Vararia minispora EC-137 TaxID=1314806 RepID=A0ACB8QEE0_9AGAM|nr:hypothetical protein K488DRAFT_88162 [Vararia minispora EC-137]